VLTDIKSLTRDELAAQFTAWQQPAYRVGQLLEWLYVQRATSWDAMTNLPKPLREQLRAGFTLQTLELVREQSSRARESADRSALMSRATTQKFLWKLADGQFIESVLIPANPALYGEASDRHTLCVSTQVGCAYGCKFCASGLDGWKRNLAPHEIVEQVLAVERWATANAECGVRNPESPEVFAIPHSALRTPRLVNNLVVMGMGEPLANYDQVLKALRILNAPWGGGIGARKITISTSGLAPQIRSLADEPEQFRLAVSLHGATDAVRNKIMPVNKKYPLKELTAALEYYLVKRGRMITFEYVLISGVNDSLEQVKPLAALARKFGAKVNLIPYNEVAGLPWKRPDDAVCEYFLDGLEKLGVTATLRREKGRDIDAACGQLRLKTERELAAGHG
jgi:23S rRNA (adenine2503-C2)-methyltransferase